MTSVQCSACMGRGKMYSYACPGFHQIERTCAKCGGTGEERLERSKNELMKEMVHEDPVCPTCSGTGRVKKLWKMAYAEDIVAADKGSYTVGAGGDVYLSCPKCCIIFELPLGTGQNDSWPEKSGKVSRIYCPRYECNWTEEVELLDWSRYCPIGKYVDEKSDG
jgi:DnaJ-class molecular chaperone